MDSIERIAELRVIQKLYDEIIESNLKIQYNKMDFPQLNDKDIADIFNYAIKNCDNDQEKKYLEYLVKSISGLELKEKNKTLFQYIIWGKALEFEMHRKNYEHKYNTTVTVNLSRKIVDTCGYYKSEDK